MDIVEKLNDLLEYSGNQTYSPQIEIPKLPPHDSDEYEDYIEDSMIELILSLDPDSLSTYQLELYDIVHDYLEVESPIGYEDIDIEGFNEEQLLDLIEYGGATLDEELLDILDEVRRKRVVRKGKWVRKIQCPPGKKAVNGRCVRMKAKEKRNRKLAQRRAKIKRRAKKNQANRRRKRSMRKRGRR